jgi:hypothetical protein
MKDRKAYWKARWQKQKKANQPIPTPTPKNRTFEERLGDMFMAKGDPICDEDAGDHE